jgi:pimeloyl-ACP methyl ester carboxylesterase
MSSSSSLSSNNPTKAILLSYGDNKMQVGELRLPNTSGDNLSPLVIIIHGGCWVSSYADYHFMDNFSQAITNLGYATWNIEYRAIGTGGEWPVIFQDINKAVDYSRDIAKHYPIDINKVAVIGHSAGGHLALWTASRANIKSTSDLYTVNPLIISGVISLAGIANVSGNNSCGGLANNVIGVPISPISDALVQRRLETSPMQMLPTKIKTILISGSTDGIVPPSMGTEYSTEAIKLGDDSLHYILQGLGHFDLIDPTKTSWSLYQQSLQEIFKD